MQPLIFCLDVYTDSQRFAKDFPCLSHCPMFQQAKLADNAGGCAPKRLWQVLGGHIATIWGWLKSQPNKNGDDLAMVLMNVYDIGFTTFYK